VCLDEPYLIVTSYIAGLLNYPVAVNLRDGIKILQKRR